MGSVLILANRDLKNRFSDEYQDSESLVRSTFRYYHRLDSMWEEGKGDLKDFLKLRFNRGKPLKTYRFPLSQKACRNIDILSMGNFKLLLQFVETSLMHGSMPKARVPLTAPFVSKLLCENFKELSLNDEDEIKVLKYLAKIPTHVNDNKFKSLIGSRTSLQEVLSGLEDRRLVKRSTRQTGVKQIYSVTQKGALLMDQLL